MLRIGLTGGIGSGKSTVASLFAARGVPVIDSDVLARDVVRIDSPAYAAILNAFGTTVIAPSGELDRARLRQRVFADPGARQALEAILHPRIRAEIERQLARLRAPYCVIVVPLLIETDFIELADRVLLVDTDEENQIARAMARSRLSRAEVEAIVAAQTGRATRRARADDIIDNNGERETLEPQIETLHRRYLELATSTG